MAAVFVLAYLASHYNLNGYIAKKAITEDLARYLGTDVSLDHAEVDIFNQVVLDQLLIKDQQSDTLLFARRAMVSFDLLPLLRKELQIHTIQLVDFDIHLSRQDSLSDTNFKFLIDVFAPKDKNNRRKVLDDIHINSVILRSGNLTYDDFSKQKRKEYLDLNHLKLENISSNLKFLSSKKDGLYVRLKRLNFEEQSGLNISHASTILQLDAEGNRFDINDLTISGEQIIEKKYKASADLIAFGSMENKKLNAEIVSLDIKIPEMLNFESDFKAEDIFSYKENMSFSADINKFTAKSKLLSHFVDKYDHSLYEKILPYLEDIDEVEINGKANGDVKNFTYNANLSSYGELGSEIGVKGDYSKEEPLNCDISAFINNIEIKKHPYQEIAVNGVLNSEYFDGNINVDDPLCSVDVQGKYYINKGSRLIDAVANIENFEPYNLNLTNISNLKDVGFSGKVLADMNIHNPKHPLGILKIDSLCLSKNDSSVFISNIDVEASRNGGLYSAKAISPILHAEYFEDSSFAKIQGEIQEERTLSELLQLPFSLTKEMKYNLQFDSLKQIVQAEINIPEILYKGNTIEANLQTHRESDFLKHILQIDLLRGNNTVSSELHVSTLFEPLYIDIDPCKLIVNKDIMECGGATISKIDSKTYDLKNFSIIHKDQSLKAEGLFSTDGKSDLAVHVENFGIDTLCSFLSSSYLKFGGQGTGDIYYRSDSVRHIETDNLFINDFSYLRGVLGDTNLKGFYDFDRKRIDVEADVLSLDNEHSNIEGYIKLGKIDSLDLTIDADKFRVEFLNHWVGGFLEDFRGTLSGSAHLYGPAKQLNLVGEPYADVSFTNHLSGSRFYVKDRIYLTKDLFSDGGMIAAENAKVFDRFGHEAHANATIKHKYLRKYNYDVRIDFPNDNQGFLLFDKPTHYNNELYWGQLYTTGYCQLKGGDGIHRVDVNCKTVGRSQFNLSPGEESYSDNGYSFLTFRDKEVFEESENADYSNGLYYFGNKEEDSDSETYIEFDIQAQATENCQVYVQMDPLAEDRLICRGNGDISLHYDPRHDITIGGEYNMTSGNYLITMRGDLMNKEFRIQNGSRVMFPGNFSNAELDIDAIYSIPSVNLRDLDESFATLASMNRTTLPVDCKLSVTGQLSAPQISFDLEVKNTSDDVQALVHNLIGTQEMLNREVFYLLLFSKFYTPEYATASQNNTGSELTSFASASLTSQLNNLLGHVSDNFTLGTNFRSDKGDFSDMEMDLSLSTRLLGDRLILNGNLGYRDPANRVGLHNNANSFIGDFDVEYLINTSGTLRAKAYSHYNERDYSINNALTTQGIGFIVRKDFKSIKELLFWKKMSEKK